MKRIVCATRGGAASRRVQDEAIALAKQQGASLTFLFVADSCSCGAMTEDQASVVREELTRMGRSLLHIAYVRAREQGLRPELVARCGPVRETIVQYVRESQADTLVVGAPRSALGSQVFGDEGIRAFAREVTEQTGVDVVIV